VVVREMFRPNGKTHLFDRGEQGNVGENYR